MFPFDYCEPPRARHLPRTLTDFGVFRSFIRLKLCAEFDTWQRWKRKMPAYVHIWTKPCASRISQIKIAIFLFLFSALIHRVSHSTTLWLWHRSNHHLYREIFSINWLLSFFTQMFGRSHKFISISKYLIEIKPNFAWMWIAFRNVFDIGNWIAAKDKMISCHATARFHSPWRMMLMRPSRRLHPTEVPVSDFIYDFRPFDHELYAWIERDRRGKKSVQIHATQICR